MEEVKLNEMRQDIMYSGEDGLTYQFFCRISYFYYFKKFIPGDPKALLTVFSSRTSDFRFYKKSNFKFGE
jgi:hypothetical protein